MNKRTNTQTYETIPLPNGRYLKINKQELNKNKMEFIQKYKEIIENKIKPTNIHKKVFTYIQETITDAQKRNKATPIINIITRIILTIGEYINRKDGTAKEMYKFYKENPNLPFNPNNPYITTTPPNKHIQLTTNKETKTYETIEEALDSISKMDIIKFTSNMPLLISRGKEMINDMETQNNITEWTLPIKTDTGYKYIEIKIKNKDEII